MRKINKFLAAVIFLASLALFSSTAAAFTNEEDYPFVSISETGTSIEAGNSKETAALVEPGVYEGSILIGEEKFYKIKLTRGQKITTLLNIRRETALDTDDQCAAMTACLNYVCQAFPLMGGPLFAPAPILSGDTSFHSIKIPDNALNAPEEKYVAEDEDYIISVSNEWFPVCVNPTPDRGKKLEEEKQKNNRAFYKLKITVEGSEEEYLAREKAELEELERYSEMKNKEEGIDARIAEAVKKDMEKESSYEGDFIPGEYSDEEDLYDGGDSGSNMMAKALLGVAAVFSFGGAGAAIFLYSRKRKAENGSIILDNVTPDKPTYQAQGLCPNCGSPTSPEMAFCGNCGNKLK